MSLAKIAFTIALTLFTVAFTIRRRGVRWALVAVSVVITALCAPRLVREVSGKHAVSSVSTNGGGTGGSYAGGGGGGKGAPGGNGGTYIQNQYNYGPPNSPSASSTPQTPLFRAEIFPDEVFILGLPIIPMMKELLTGKPYAIIDFREHGWDGQPSNPILIHLKGRRFYVDAQLWDAPGRRKAMVNNNACLLIEPYWDCNFNNIALEIVDEEQRPVFQMIYTASGPANLVINGVFPYPDRILVGSNTLGYTQVHPDETGHPNIPWNYTKRIFKYPSWKYRGRYDESGN